MGGFQTGVYAYNDKLSGNTIIGRIALTLIKVAGAWLGDIDEVRTEQGRKAIYSSRVRTLVDAVYDWSPFNGLPRTYDWIRSDIEKQRIEDS